MREGSDRKKTGNAVFLRPADPVTRNPGYDYLTVFADAAGTTYQSGNVLLRLDNALQSEKRALYEAAFLGIVK